MSFERDPHSKVVNLAIPSIEVPEGVLLAVHNSELPLPSDLLPQSSQALALDGIARVTKGDSAIGFWSPNKDFHFKGHFRRPGKVLPGHWTLEHQALVGLYAVLSGEENPEDKAVKLDSGYIEPVEMIVPNDTVFTHAVITDRDKRSFKGVGVSWIYHKEEPIVVARGHLTASLMTNRLLGRSYADTYGRRTKLANEAKASRAAVEENPEQ